MATATPSALTLPTAHSVEATPEMLALVPRCKPSSTKAVHGVIMRRCNHCGEWKDLTPDNFSRHRADHILGMAHRCKVCNAELCRKYQKEHRGNDVTETVKTKETKMSRATAMFAAGEGPAAVARSLGVKSHAAQTMHRIYKERTGDPSMHHVGKATMLERLLGDRKNLRVYESCGYCGETNRLGVCNKVYAAHGEVVARSKKDGDWLHVTRMTVMLNQTFDVVDFDGYGDPADVLMLGGILLVREGGLLITTWPAASFYLRHPIQKARAILHCGGAVMRPNFVVEKYAMLHGFIADHVETATFDRTLRVVHRLRKVKWAKKEDFARNVRVAASIIGGAIGAQEAP